MELSAEVVSRFDELKACDGLLYAPLGENLSYRRTRFYRFEFSGAQAGLERFIRSTLVDSVSQDVRQDGRPALEGFRFYLDYGMKPGVLDLEKESILNYYGELKNLDFKIEALELSTRVYIFGEAREGENLSEPFVRDIVNPAIHRWSIHDARSCA